MSDKGGNTSAYKIYHQGKMKYFIKSFQTNGFDISSFTFQNYLYNNFKSDLKICKPIKIVSEKSNEVQIYYEYVKPIDWELTADRVSFLGKSLAELHNFCYLKKNEISLPDKVAVVAMGKWQDVEDSFDKELAVSIRKAIYDNLKPYDRDQIRIPLHRDFKLHNIMFDGENLNLIDFDFAAIDNIGIEIMSFIIDFYYETRDQNLVSDFIKAYKQESNLDINWTSVLNDYLVYMCVNTFPFYMRGRIGEHNFKNLLTERNGKLNFTYINKDFLYESLQR
jgi:thiamine kinase-like enzyme